MHNSNLKIKCVEWAEIHGFVRDYIRENKIIIDSFWEDHVLLSNYYLITDNGKAVGYFAIHEGSTITLFNVFDEYANKAQEIFAEVRKYESVTNAMVVTGDEMFLSHCVDNYSKLEKQGYFSVYTDKEIPKDRFINISLRLADIDKDSETLKLSGDFLDGEIENIRKGLNVLKIYVTEFEDEVVGFGVIQYGQVVEDIASIGMFVCEKYRQKGFAANILQGLKNIAQSNGCKAYSGCWYYNHNSKKSMESAGAFSKTRLLRFYF